MVLRASFHLCSSTTGYQGWAKASLVQHVLEGMRLFLNSAQRLHLKPDAQKQYQNLNQGCVFSSSSPRPQSQILSNNKKTNSEIPREIHRDCGTEAST